LHFSIFGSFQEVSRKFPGSFQEVSRKFPGSFQENPIRMQVSNNSNFSSLVFEYKGNSSIVFGLDPYYIIQTNMVKKVLSHPDSPPTHHLPLSHPTCPST
jgi:hypothetical protein